MPSPYAPNLFAQLAFPQIQLMTAAAQMPAFALSSILSTYGNAFGAASSMLQNALIPPFMSMPSPGSVYGQMGPIAGGGYAQPQQVDLAPFSPNDFLSRAFDPDRREAARMEYVLRNDPFARAAFEQAIGGRIIGFDGQNDGRFTIERDPAQMYPYMSFNNPVASQLSGMYQQMDRGILASLGTLGGTAIGGVGGALIGGLGGQIAGGLGGAVGGGLSGAALGSVLGPGGALLGGLGGAAFGSLTGQVYGRAAGTVAGGLQGASLGGQLGGALLGGPFLANPFLSLTLGGVGNMMSQLSGGFDSFSGGVQGMPLFGTGQASWNPLAQPGLINGSNSSRELAHSAQFNSILSDPSLTMEDKIMLGLMLICSKMDDDIKRQTEYLDNLQNQQGNRGKAGGKLGLLGGVAGAALGGPIGAKVGSGLGSALGSGGGGGQDGEKSIDLETKKLERMITKRSTLFDTLSKTMERYDQSAKNVIQSMRG